MKKSLVKSANLTPRPKLVIENYRLDEDKKRQLEEKLKREGIKKVDFYREVVNQYLKED